MKVKHVIITAPNTGSVIGVRAAGTMQFTVMP